MEITLIQIKLPHYFQGFLEKVRGRKLNIYYNFIIIYNCFGCNSYNFY